MEPATVIKYAMLLAEGVFVPQLSAAQHS